MKCKYAKSDYSQRLDGCFFLLNNTPVQLSASGDGIFYRVSQSSDYEKLEDLESLDISSIPLGYVNSDNQVFYFRRDPLRSYKQGIHPQNIRAYLLDGRYHNSAKHLIGSTPFWSMLRGEYPKMSTVLNSKKVNYQIAVSRDIAISVNELGLRTVYYKNKLVGWMEPDSTTVHVPTSEMAQVVSYYLDGLGWEID